MACRYDSGEPARGDTPRDAGFSVIKTHVSRGFPPPKCARRSRTFDRKPPARRLNSLSVKCNRGPRRNAPGSRNTCPLLALWEHSASSPLACHECASRAERTGFALRPSFRLPLRSRRSPRPVLNGCERAHLPRRQADRSRQRERRPTDRRDKARLARASARDGRARAAKPAWFAARWDSQPAARRDSRPAARARGASARKATARSAPSPGLWLEQRLPA
jgi:hypothetical protein